MWYSYFCSSISALVDRQQGHGCDEHGGHALGRQHGVVAQTPLLADDFPDKELPGLVLDDAGDLLADLPVQRLIDTFRPEADGLQDGQVLYHAPHLALPLRGGIFFHGQLLHCLVTLLPGLAEKVGKLSGEEVGAVGVEDGALLRLASEELLLQPCDLGFLLLYL